MISYAQLCEALAGAAPVNVPLPTAPTHAPTPGLEYAAAQPLPPAPSDDHENTVTNLNLASVDQQEPDEVSEVEIGDAEIDAEE